ncbi:NAD(P)H-dependent oxidoreductase [Segnochrobactraceae bacterium EtOH-i3]
MRVFVLYAHPVETSFVSALHTRVVETLRLKGHDVDDCDLYAEGFNPVLSRSERMGYHDLDHNRAPVDRYVQRVLDAEAMVMVHPVWNFGYPAMLKGFFDRVFLPGVSFRMQDGKVRPCLHNIRKLCTVTTYGGSRVRALLAGDPPRKVTNRVLRVTIKPAAPVSYLAHYDMNRSTPETRAAFLAKVTETMEAF